MLTKFWEALGGKLADRWAAVSFPALLFWLGGALAFLYGAGIADGYSLLESLARQPAPLQLGVLVALLALVGGSGALVAVLAMPALRLLEGYWPESMEALRERLVARAGRHASTLDARFQQLAGPVMDGTASGRERSEYVRLDRALRRFPVEGSLQPTRIGNILRAAESRPADKYGLDAVTVWPHLWLLLPSTTQGEIGAAQQSLSAAASACVWGVLFLVFGLWAWWAIPAGLGVAIVAYRCWAPSRAEVVADLVEAAFDLYRTNIYVQLRWPLPADPASERIAGRQVTAYLWRGLDGDTPKFSAPASGSRPAPK